VNRLKNLALVCLLAVLLACGGVLLDGPSEHQAATATAASLADAELASRRFERDYRACQLAKGPTADLIQIQGTEHYVCRDMPIEPTPAEMLQRYAQLGANE
jgi:hypothetical protein